MSLSQITETECRFNALLPASRIEQKPTAQLLAAALAWSQNVWAVAVELGPTHLSPQEVSKGNALAKRPVFICGVHRSGTTLIRDLLDGHPNLVVLPAEGTYYTNIQFKLKALPQHQQAAFLCMEWLRRLANPINQAPYWLLGRSTGTHSPYVAFAKYLLAWWRIIDKKNTQWPHLAIMLAYASCIGKLTAKFWADKTPSNERFINRIWKEMPDAKIIHAIREPLATLASRKRMEPSVNMRTALLALKLSFRFALKQSILNSPNFLLLRYEELCEHPQAVIQKLASFLHIQPLQILMQPTVAGKPSQANSSFNKHAARGQILKLVQPPPQQVLSIKERRLIAACLGKLAGKLRYPPVKISFLNKLYLRLKYRL